MLQRIARERLIMQAFNCSYAEMLGLPAQVVRDHLTYLKYQREHGESGI